MSGRAAESGPLEVTLSPDLRAIVGPAVLQLDSAALRDADTRLDRPIAASQSAVVTAPLDPVIAAVRAMYKRTGVDPTKTRPSSEALLRRVRKGEPLPRINTAVDVCNWCSVETQLPYGLYDRDAIVGRSVVLRLGGEGEEYAGIRKDAVHVAGRLTLVDGLGPFGNPTSDSLRTMVTARTTRLLVVIFAPRALGDALVRRAIDVTAERMTQFTGATEVARALL